MNSYLPGYLKLSRKGILQELAESLWNEMKHCCLCPRECGVDRLAGNKGYCGASAELKIAGYMIHFGEEPSISGINGSGTIFFSNCSLRCVYCQNYSFSQEGEGVVYSIDELAGIILELQDKSVHNINFVTPEHYLPHILLAVERAVKRGFCLPIVYNTSGYISLKILKLLDGVIDIYLTDMKYMNSKWSGLFSSCCDYPVINQLAVKEMYRQVNDYIFDDDNIIKRGLIIRHLVLPKPVSDSFLIMNWIKRNLGSDVFISLMSQYNPCYKAKDYSELAHRIDLSYYNEVKETMVMLGLTKGWWQDGYGLDSLSGENIKEKFSK